MVCFKARDDVNPKPKWQSGKRSSMKEYCNPDLISESSAENELSVPNPAHVLVGRNDRGWRDILDNGKRVVDGE